MPVYSTLLHDCFVTHAIHYILTKDPVLDLTKSHLIFTDFAIMRAFMQNYLLRERDSILMPHTHVLDNIRLEHLQPNAWSENRSVMDNNVHIVDQIILQTTVKCCKSTCLSFTTSLSYANFIWENLEHMTVLSGKTRADILRQWISMWINHNSIGMAQVAQSLLQIIQSKPDLNLDHTNQLLCEKLTQQIMDWHESGDRIYLIGMPNHDVITGVVLKTLLSLQQAILAPHMCQIFTYQDVLSHQSCPMHHWTSYYLDLWKLFNLPTETKCHILTQSRQTLARIIPTKNILLANLQWQSLTKEYIERFDARLINYTANTDDLRNTKIDIGNTADLLTKKTKHDHDDTIIKSYNQELNQQLQQIEYEDTQTEILGLAIFIIRELQRTETHKERIQVFLPDEDYANKLKNMLRSLNAEAVEDNVSYMTIEQTVDGRAWLSIADLLYHGAAPAAVFGFLRQHWIQAHLSVARRTEINKYELKIRKRRFSLPFLCKPTENNDFALWLRYLLILINRGHGRYHRIRPSNPLEIFSIQLQILQWVTLADKITPSVLLKQQTHQSFNNHHDLLQLIETLPIFPYLKKVLYRCCVIGQSDIKLLAADWCTYVQSCCKKSQITKSSSMTDVNRELLSKDNTQETVFDDNQTKRLNIYTTLSTPLYDSDIIICAGMDIDNACLSENQLPILDSIEYSPYHQKQLLELYNHKQCLLNFNLMHAKRLVMTRAKNNTHGQHSIPHPLWVLIKHYSQNNNLSVTVDDEFQYIIQHAQKKYQNYNQQESRINDLPAPHPERCDRQDSISITDIKYLWRNPYVIFAKRILKLPILLNLNMEPSYQDRGLCFHVIMEKFWQQKLEDLTFVNFIKIVDDNLQKWRNIPKVRFLWRQQFVFFGQWLVDCMVPWYRKQVRNIWLEVRGSKFIDNLSLNIKGIADVIYQLQDGTYGIIDYKTSSIPTMIKVRQGIEPQLSMEALMLQQDSFVLPGAVVVTTPKLSVQRLTYLGLSNKPYQPPTCVSFDLTKETFILKQTSHRVCDFLQKFYALSKKIINNRAGRVPDYLSDETRLQSFTAVDNGKEKDYVEDQYSQLMRLEG